MANSKVACPVDKCGRSYVPGKMLKHLTWHDDRGDVIPAEARERYGLPAARGGAPAPKTRAMRAGC